LGQEYKERVKGQLDAEIAQFEQLEKENLLDPIRAGLLKECRTLREDMDEGMKEGKYKTAISAPALSKEANQMLEKAEHDGAALHNSSSIESGNLWASTLFAMTAFHVLPVLGGLVVVGTILIMVARGKFTPAAKTSVFGEVTGLYWHFVDAVLISL